MKWCERSVSAFDSSCGEEEEEEAGLGAPKPHGAWVMHCAQSAVSTASTEQEERATHEP